MSDGEQIHDLFLLAHPDDVAFARQLAAELDAHGISCRAADDSSSDDLERQALQDASLNAHVVAIALSPASAGSQLCNEIIEFAVAHGKRFLSLIINEDIKVDVHPAIAQNPYVFFRDGEPLEESVKRLLPFLALDAHTRLHSDLLLRAHRWQAGGRKSDLLLPPEEAETARQWLADGANQTPKPSPLQVEYIHASRRQLPQPRRLPKWILPGVALVILLIAAAALAGQFNAQQTLANATAAARQTRQAGTQAVISAAMTATAESDRAAQLLDMLAATSLSLRDELLAAARLQAEQATATAEASATAAAEARARATQARATEMAGIQREITAQGLMAHAARALEAGDPELALALAKEASLNLSDPAEALPLMQEASARLPVLALDDVVAYALHPLGAQVAIVPSGRDRVVVYDMAKLEIAFELAAADENISHLAYSSDGNLLVTGGLDGAFAVYASSDGAALKQFQAHESRLHALALSRSEERLFTAGDEPGLAAWDLRTGERIASADGLETGSLDSMLVTAGGERLIVWSTVDDKPLMAQYDSETLDALSTADDEPVYRGADEKGRIAYSGGRSLPAFSGDRDVGELTLWDARSGQEMARISDGFNWTMLSEAGLTAAADSLQFIAFGADMALLGVEESLGARRVAIVSLDDGALLKTYDNAFAASLTSAHLQDDSAVSVTSDGRLVQWSLHDGALMRTLGHIPTPLRQDSAHLAGGLVAGHTQRDGLHLWRAHQNLLRTLDDARVDAWLTQAGDALLLADENGARLQPVASDATTVRIDDALLAAMNASGTRFAIYDGAAVAMYAADSGERLTQWTLDADISALYLASTGDPALAANEAGDMWLLEHAHPPLRLASTGLREVMDARFATESAAFITRHSDGLAWRDGRIAAPIAVYALPDSAGLSIALNPDGETLQVFARLDDGLAGYSEIRRDGSSRMRAYLDIAAGELSADGAHLTLLYADGGVRISDIASGGDSARFQTELGSARQLTYVPGAERLFAADGKELWAWDTSSGIRLARIKHARELIAFSVSGDGGKALTQDAGGRYRLWHVPGSDESLRRIERENQPRRLACDEREAYLALPLCE